MAIDYAQLFTRENPTYSARSQTWRRNRAAYGGGRRYLDIALIQHIAEIKDEYAERLKRGYYINYPRKIARLITQFALAHRPERVGASDDYLEDWSRTGLRTDEVMRQMSTMLNVYGVAWLAVDMPTFAGEKTKQEEIAERLRPYVTALSPLAVVDWCVGADGLFDWVLVAERSMDNSNPFAQPVWVDVRKLWTRRDVTICSRRGDGAVASYTVEHGLGEVPFIRQEECDGYGIGAEHWFDDVVGISDAILNNESEAQMNVVKQLFGLLVVPESFAANAGSVKLATGETATLSQVIARSAGITESMEDKGISRYISPSGTDNATIREMNLALKRELYEMVGLAISQDTRLVASAEAKAWDFQGVEQYLKTRADMLEQAERKAWILLNKWNPAVQVPEVTYSRQFAVLDLKESVASLLELSSFNVGSPEYQREVGFTAFDLLNRIRQISPERAEAVLRELSSEQHGGGVDNHDDM